MLGTTLQERSKPSEEALDRTPDINIGEENKMQQAEKTEHERRMKKMEFLNQTNKN